MWEHENGWETQRWKCRLRPYYVLLRSKLSGPTALNIILKRQHSLLCSLCGGKDENVSHIVSRCKKLAKEQYKWRYMTMLRRRSTGNCVSIPLPLSSQSNISMIIFFHCIIITSTTKIIIIVIIILMNNKYQWSEWRQMVVDICRDAKWQGKYPPLSPTLRWILLF